MKTPKQQLSETVGQLSSSDVLHVLEYTRRLGRHRDGNGVLRRLAEDSAFRVPAGTRGKLKRIRPIRTDGKPASEILIEARR